jgi:glycosyltransferase involved in cell wall biosynthesis
MRVLLSAYACEPSRGSEPGVGWNRVRQISLFHEVWVLTRSNNREPIEQALAAEPLPRAHFVYCDLPRWARFWKKGSRGLRLYYYLWQCAAYCKARGLHREIGFDLAHHVTFVNCWQPSIVALLPVPFVWGPVGGAESMPRALRNCLSFSARIHELARDLARFRGRMDPFLRATARRASMTLTTTRQTQQFVERLGCRRTEILLEAGISAEERNWLRGFAGERRGPFRLLSLGTLIHWKGFDLGLRAFAEFHRDHPESEYWIVGDGAQRKHLERLARQLAVADSVVFWGERPRAEAVGRLAECDVLVHPSLHDSGGWVCLEAMAAGRPVVCLDLGGPGEEVTGETGIKIAAHSPAQAVHDMAGAFRKLAADPALRARLGAGGQRRVEEHFAWEKKTGHMLEIYRAVTSPPGLVAGARRVAGTT